MRRPYKIWLALSIIPQFILVKVLGNYPNWVETYYAEGLYPHIAKFLRFLFGWIPFSMGDIFYTLLAFAALRYLYTQGRNLYKKPKTVLLDVGCVVAVAYAIFHLSWGLNYYRLPIQEKMGFSATYNNQELADFTLKMVRVTNRLHKELTADSTQNISIPYSTKEIYAKTLKSYESAAAIFPQFTYQTPSLKSSLYALPLTYMGYGGYLNPFTNEAQVNHKVPAVRLPSISGHEVGHQLGYSSESATNFIGLLVTASNPDPYFKYAARSHALAYCLTDLKSRDPKAFNEIYAKLNSGVKKDYALLNKFWRQYDNPAEPLFKGMYNIFLKANNQTKGIKSYNAVVGLLIGFDKTQ